MQIFPRSLNMLPLAAAIALGGLGTVVIGGVWYYGSPKFTQVGYAPKQPVAYSHRLHAGKLGMDCRYCHTNIENAAHAMIPPTQTCMGCHALVKKDSALLEPVRESWKTGKPIEWIKVHKLPDHVYFNHSVHLAAGVGCVSCHGRVDRMDIVKVTEPISMQWCLDCHRDPAPHLRPREEITNMTWKPTPAFTKRIRKLHADEKPVKPSTRLAVKDPWNNELEPPEHCSGCHR